MSEEISVWEAILLGVIEGFTEFLPISSTGHLTVVTNLLGYEIDSRDVTAFTAIIQIGAILATIVYFRRDMVRLVGAALVGIREPSRRDNPDWRLAVALFLGSLPIGIVGLVFRDTIETTLRSLWFVAVALIVWSGVMLLADRTASLHRGEADVRWRDTLIIGVVQCMALIPGISRSGATLSAGLALGLDRVTVTRLSFFLAIPALSAATILQVVTRYGEISTGVGWSATLVATATSFVVAYGAIAWLLRFIASHTYLVFIVYRVLIGSAILALLAAGTLTAT